LLFVLKFQFDHARFQREVSTNFSGKVEKRKKEEKNKKRKNRASTPVSNTDTERTTQTLHCS